MSQFSFVIPGEVVLGAGVVNKLAEIGKSYGSKAYLCIDPFLEISGVGSEIEGLLKKDGVDIVKFTKVKPNPSCHDIDEGADLCRKEKCDFIVAVGGGSAIDTAKAIAILAINPGNSWEYIARSDREFRTFSESLPLIAVPTTAGTGTEVTHYSVISNPDIHEKGCIHNKVLVPDFALVDPELMVSKPPKLTAYTGIDAMCHSLESFLNVNSTPFPDMIALESVSLVARYLPEAVANGTNIVAREKMAYASTLGGVAIALAGTILPHGLGQPVSGLVDMPHGASMAASLGYIMEISYTSNIEKFARLAECFGESLDGLSTYAKAEMSVEFVQRLLKDTGAEVTFGEYGLTEADLEKTAEIAVNNYSFDLNNSPLKVSKEEIIEIYRNCL